MKALTTFLLAWALLAAPALGYCSDKASKECDQAVEAWDAGHPEKAQMKFEEVLRKWPGTERARLMLGLLHVQYAHEAEKNNQWDRAAEEYSQALSFDPDEPYWMSGLARALESKGEAEGAVVECANAARLSPLDDGLAHGCGLKSAAAKHDGDAKQDSDKPQVSNFKPGIDITAPVPLLRPAPPFPEKARQAKYQSTSVLSIVVGQDGAVRMMAVIRPAGLGLDEKALEAVKKWTFQPSNLHGEPVPVHVLIEVSFRLTN